MPQLDLKYSANLKLDNLAIFTAVEQALLEQDSSTGICKSRAYPTTEYLHTHVLLQVVLLRKPHRDDVFMQTYLAKLDQLLAAHVPAECFYAVEVNFCSQYYLTQQK